MDINEVKYLAESSAKITNWSFCVTGGSIIVLLAINYLKLASRKLKASYLLFLVGWVFLALAIKYGSDIASDSIVLVVQQLNESDFLDTLLKVRTEYASQLYCLNAALLTFGLWLVIYLLWLIITPSQAKKAKRGHAVAID